MSQHPQHPQQPSQAGPQWPVMSIAEAHARLTAPGAPFETETRVIRGIPTTVWKNAPPTLRDLFLVAAAWGEKTFVVYEDERVSYRAFALAATALAHQLVRDGVSKGDRVAVAMRNLPEWPVALYGGVLAGAIVTPLNAWWTGPELEYGLSDSGSRIAIVDHERLDRILEHLPNCPALERIYVSRAPADATFDDPRIVSLAAVLGESDADRKSTRLNSSH